MLVGAGGHFCPVGRYLGNKGSPAPVLAQEIEFEMDGAQAAQLEDRWRTSRTLLLPRHEGLRLGLPQGRLPQCGTRPHRLPRDLASRERLRRLLARRRARSKLRTSGIAGHAYGLWGRTDRKILDDGVLLVGDAAGLAYPESGEGIRPAIESGLIAAHAILSAEGNYSTKNLSLYRELLNARLQREHSRLDSLIQALAARHQGIRRPPTSPQPLILPERRRESVVPARRRTAPRAVSAAGAARTDGHLTASCSGNSPISPWRQLPRTWPSPPRHSCDSPADRPTPEHPLWSRAHCFPARSNRLRVVAEEDVGMQRLEHVEGVPVIVGDARVRRVLHKVRPRIYPSAVGKHHDIRTSAFFDGRDPGRAAASVSWSGVGCQRHAT